MPINDWHKDFEEEYKAYLAFISDVNHIPIFDTKQELTKPRTMERNLRDKFINELQKQNKIDNYEINIRPIIQEIAKKCLDDNESLNDYRKYLHPGTISKLA